MIKYKMKMTGKKHLCSSTLCDVDCLGACNTCNTNIAQAGSLQVCSRCFDSLVMIPVFPPIIMSWPVWQMWSPSRDSKGNSELQLFLPYKISCIRGSLDIPWLSLITRRLTADIWPGLARVIPMRSLGRARDQVSCSEQTQDSQSRSELASDRAICFSLILS